MVILLAYPILEENQQKQVMQGKKRLFKVKYYSHQDAYLFWSQSLYSQFRVKRERTKPQNVIDVG